MQLRIDTLGHRGDGIARAGEATIHVARALPGELVEGTPEAGRILRPRILEPSPARVAAPCPHYRACGGCAVQHLADADVERWKAGIVRTALAAQGIEAEIAAIRTSPPASRRRATFAGRRLKGGALVGFHGRASQTLAAVPACRVVTPALRDALGALEALTAALGTRTGALRLTVTESETGLDVAIADAPEPGADRIAGLAAIAGAAGIARLSVGGETVAQDRAPVLRFDGMAVTPPPGAFLQATQEGETALRDAVGRATAGAARIADLFAGCGTFALPLSRRAAVHAVEAEARPLAALDAGWRAAGGLRPLSTECRDLFRRPLAPDELDRFDAVVIDPPRAGAEAQVRALAASRVARIAAVSCNPATFARDARLLLAAGFRLGPVTVIDQFRWSPHVELAAAFAR